jgi:HPt (histidine-containing phosphotransfer) domain-containing protein
MTDTPNKAEPLYSVLGGDPELAGIVELFVEEMPDRVETLIDRFDRCDWEGLRRAAHQLKGAAGSYGFEAISPLAGRLEDVLTAGAAPDEVRHALDDLVKLCGRASGGAPSEAQWGAIQQPTD